MQQSSPENPVIPDLILLLGTDASGKNHVANLWLQRLKGLGHDMDVREGRLSAKSVTTDEDAPKSRLSLTLEATFLWFFPFIRWMLAPALALLLRWDTLRYRPSKGKRLVISHNALRILALLFGYRRKIKTMPAWLKSAVCNLQDQTKAMVIVLDVDHGIRQERIQHRLKQNQVDPFDRYMAADGQRSERIEAWLVQLAQDCYQATVIENNNLSDDALWEGFLHACRCYSETRNDMLARPS